MELVETLNNYCDPPLAGFDMGQLDKSGSNIAILPETDDRTLCVSLSGVISRSEYETAFYRPLQDMVDKGKKFSLLINYEDDFQGWDKDAAQMSFQSIIEHGKYARRLAYVNPPESKIFQNKISKSLLGGEIRYFNGHELNQALEWVKQV